MFLNLLLVLNLQIFWNLFSFIIFIWFIYINYFITNFTNFNKNLRNLRPVRKVKRIRRWAYVCYLELAKQVSIERFDKNFAENLMLTMINSLTKVTNNLKNYMKKFNFLPNFFLKTNGSYEMFFKLKVFLVAKVN